MKFITEEAYQLESEICEEINESTGKTQKNYYISGIFSTPGQKNKNGRIYPQALWETEVQRYQEEITNNTINTLGEWEHPARTSVDPLKAVMKMTEVQMKDGIVYGKAKILNNNSDKTNQLKSLIDEGMKIGVSSRGVGSVKNGIVENFRLTTWDAVASPSDYNCNLAGITESLNESIGDINFSINDQGTIIQAITESEDSFTQNDVNEAVINKFSEMMNEIVQRLPKSATFPSLKNNIGCVCSFNDPMTGGKKEVKLFFASKEEAKRYCELKKYTVEAVGANVR